MKHVLIPGGLTLLVAVLVVLALPGQQPPPAEPSTPPSAPSVEQDPFVRHVAELSARLPEGDFQVVIQKPFVVVGDESLSTVKRRAKGTVQWATDLLKESYFPRDPQFILDVWLFKDKASYEKNAEALFGSVPDTPFGYYSAHDRALVMNISTGGGTLVHEMVHAFMDTNFPECPAWLNEGLGSLYEQCAERNGRIEGLTNWRLAGLQKAIRAKTLPSFETLIATTTSEFYGEDRGTNYAQARYLLYYLEQKKLLRKFYRKFVADHEKDPSGLGTLKRVLGEEKLGPFQKRWESYVLGLRFRG